MKCDTHKHTRTVIMHTFTRSELISNFAMKVLHKEVIYNLLGFTPYRAKSKQMCLE